MQLRKATRQKAKIRLGLSAQSGGGKTYSAILIAKGLTGDLSKVAIIDTENGSADLYASLGDYQVLTLEAPYTPERYISAIKACEQAGMECIIVDSISHEWDGKGGCLEIIDSLGGKYQEWAKVTPRHQAFVQAMLTSSAHIITTVRRKQDYEMTKDASGKVKVEKVGLKETTREGWEYELSVNLQLDQRHNATASKDRTGLFADKPEFVPTVETGEMIRRWCETGEMPTTAALPEIQKAGLAIDGNKVSLPPVPTKEDVSAYLGAIHAAATAKDALELYVNAPAAMRQDAAFENEVDAHMTFTFPEEWDGFQPSREVLAVIGKTHTVPALTDLYYSKIEIFEKSALLKAALSARKLQVKNDPANG